MYRELYSLRQVLQQELKDTLPPLPGVEPEQLLDTYPALKNRLGLTEIFRAGRGGGAVTRTISARRFPRGLDRSCR